MRLATALVLLASAATAAEPALVISGADWTLPVAAGDVREFKTYPPPGGGGLAFVVALNDAAAETLARETTEGLGEVVTFTDREGGVLLETPLEAPIVNGVISIAFTDREAALTMARRLRGFQ